MSMRRLLLLALAAVSACSHPPRSPAVARQASCRPDYISDSAVAGLPIGASVASVKAHCRVLEDTTFPGLEGLPERTLLIQVGADSLVAEIDSERVFRIDVDSPRFTTRDSLRVGTRLARLLRDTSAQALIGEGNYYVVMRSHCGLSFALPHIDLLEPRGDLDAAALRRLPDTLAVRQILVIRCGASRGAT